MKKKRNKDSIKKVKKIRINIERPHNMGLWTQSMFFSKIRQILRNGFRYYKPLQQALINARRPSQSDNKKLKFQYQCNMCKQWFDRKSVEIDHLQECGSLRNWDDVVPFIQRLTAENPEDYQILCKEKCHPLKTKLYKESLK